MKILKKLTPEQFVDLFRQELSQTIAFLLFFVRDDAYVSSVLKILNNEGLNKLVKEYLSGEHKLNVRFVSLLEKYIKKTVKEYRRKNSLGIFRFK
ncbi:hypothetical protein AGMMS50293_23160 [Spirochaetia bacterium]|nr:hypothetical protein AGMMS50293_23160 [Spirochaetia bacterium]